ncbi:hypothetical protein BOC35_28555 [Burkholderia pseudomallei]|nr:hypothetical protein BOC35_28555 [Burkholderia pseudomallei]
MVGWGSSNATIQQALVHMANLFDGERAIAHELAHAISFGVFEAAQNIANDGVPDSGRFVHLVWPLTIFCAAFKKWVSVWIKQLTTMSSNADVGVDTAVMQQACTRK